MKKLLAAAATFMLLAPMLGLLSIGVLVNPAVLNQANCIASGVILGPIPDELEVTMKDGYTFTLNKQQLTHASTIITTGSSIPGVGRDGILIALMAALTESTLRQLANTGTYPESGDYPNDGDDSDHDSLGLFQMRPQAGWGTVAELMDTTYQARAFYGDPTAPTTPHPAGLLDIPGWQQMDKGEAAQAVEVSAYPDRYQNYEPVARTILDTLTRNSGGNGAGCLGILTFPRAVGWCSRYRRAATSIRRRSGRGSTPSPGRRVFTPEPTGPPPTAPRSSPSRTASSPTPAWSTGTPGRSPSSTPSAARRSRRSTSTCGRTASTSPPGTASSQANTSATSGAPATPPARTWTSKSTPAARTGPRRRPRDLARRAPGVEGIDAPFDGGAGLHHLTQAEGRTWRGG